MLPDTAEDLLLMTEPKHAKTPIKNDLANWHQQYETHSNTWTTHRDGQNN